MFQVFVSMKLCRRLRPPMRHTVGLVLDASLPEIIGHGSCLQIARHNAATDALNLLHSASIPSAESAEQSTNETDEAISNKSTISLVHERSLQRRMDVKFEVRRRE